MTTTASQAERSSHLARRTISGLALAAIVFGSIATVPTFTLVVLGITLTSLWELAGLTAKKGQALIFPVAAVAVAVYTVLAAMNLQHAYEKTLLGLTIIASLAFSLAGERQGYFARSAFTVFGVLYIGWLGSYFIALRNLPAVGTAYVIASIVAISFTDIFAMVVGTAIGRTPLTSISPNKTWEGAIGGLLATTAVGACLALVPVLQIPWWHGAIVGAITSFAAQTGDIVESALKRDAHVKDAGTILWGHGGILDRYDSYTFGGIAFYAALYVTGHIPAAHP
ncbi:MAG: phosphatidate cytidylyltransferase [Candidatus Eremiobacteraeota bacterium]|nr:phosphatidate cytidylyltransferase [Candidatus Eremiobacteraeota bacterium]